MASKPRSIMKSLRIKDFLRADKFMGLVQNITMNLPGTFAEFSFPFIVETATEQASTFMKTYDLSATEYQDVATSSTGAGYAADYQLFPDTEQIGDFCLMGAAAPFGVVKIDVSATAATYSADGVTWYYWNGTEWSALTITFDTTNTTPAAGGVRPFMQDGFIVFDAPTDWVASTIDSQEAYWIKADLSAATVTQIPLLDSHEHYIITCTTGFEAPLKGEVGRGRASFVTVSASNADSKFILCNLTTGASSAIKTLTKAVASGQEIADFDLVVAAGDVLAVFGTDEDGTTEFADGRIELTITGTQ